MPPLKYPTKPFFFMIARYPNATPEQWILPQSLQPPKKKNIGSSSNNSTITCRMQYAQTIKNASPPNFTNGYTPKARSCLNLVY
jgi:hypothetical protein